MTATLQLRFADGSTQDILLESVVEINVPKASLEFSANNKGEWTMRVTKGLLLNRKLAEEFLTVRKNA